jgi:hypothetical protein
LFSRLQPVLVDVYEQGVLRRAAVAFPQVGLPKSDLVERHLRKTIAAVGQALRVRERAEDLRYPAPRKRAGAAGYEWLYLANDR